MNNCDAHRHLHTYHVSCILYHTHMTVLACLVIIRSFLLVQDTNILILAHHMLLQRGPDDQKMHG